MKVPFHSTGASLATRTQHHVTRSSSALHTSRAQHYVAFFHRPTSPRPTPTHSHRPHTNRPHRPLHPMCGPRAPAPRAALGPPMDPTGTTPHPGPAPHSAHTHSHKPRPGPPLASSCPGHRRPRSGPRSPNPNFSCPRSLHATPHHTHLITTTHLPRQN